MENTATATLVGLRDSSDLVLACADDDVRGHIVVDLQGHRVGEVDDLVVDQRERRVRLLVVASGGLQGLGRTCHLLPVDAVTNVGDSIQVETTHEHVHAAEHHLGVMRPPRYEQAYRHFGYLPFWEKGYVDPYFLRRSEGAATGRSGSFCGAAISRAV